jgi:hypothetical protein
MKNKEQNIKKLNSVAALHLLDGIEKSVERITVIVSSP